MSASEQGGRRKQSRIVIDVDRMQQEAAARGRGRAGRGRRRALSIVGLVFLVVIVGLVLGGYLWWQSYKKGPGYSLALLVDAAQRNDVPAVEQLIDMDAVARSLAPQVVDRALASVGGAGTLPAPRRQIEAALPNLLPYARDQVRTAIAESVKQVASKTGGRLPFPLLALAVPRTWESIKDGDERGEGRDVLKTVAFKMGERPVTLTLQQSGDRWKVVGVRDEQLASDIAARVIGGLSTNPDAARQLENQRRRPARQR